MGSRDSRGEVSKQINCFDFQLECFTNRKNTLFYRAFGRNHQIETIDGYDGMVQALIDDSHCFLDNVTMISTLGAKFY